MATTSLTGYVVTGQTDPRFSQDIGLEIGVVNTVNLAVKNPDGSAFDLTSASVQFIGRAASGAVVFDWPGIVNTPASGGTAYASIPVNATQSRRENTVASYFAQVTSGGTSYAVVPLSRLLFVLPGTPVQQNPPPAPIVLGPAVISFMPKKITGTYRASYNDFVNADPTSGGFTITLPAAVAATTSGNSVVVAGASNSNNTITIAPFGNDTIGGVTGNITVQGRETVFLVSDGSSNWTVM